MIKSDLVLLFFCLQSSFKVSNNIQLAPKYRIKSHHQHGSRMRDFWAVFGLLLTVRIASIFIVNTFFSPDEYWQSLEVGHKLVYGYVFEQFCIYQVLLYLQSFYGANLNNAGSLASYATPTKMKTSSREMC